MKYPYIGQCYSAFVLFYGDGKGLVLGDALGVDENTKVGDRVKLNGGTNITAEYLANTYGKVESKEHAEFIVKLADSAGFKVGSIECQDRWFCFTEKYLYFYPVESRASDAKEKLITIPLPPKEEVMQSQKEWPAVGDEVLYSGSSERLKEIKGEIVKVIGKYSFDADNYVTVKHNEHGVFAMRLGSWIKKPPTQEEELRVKLISVMDNSNTAFAYADFISKAIINGEIEGLEYKPQNNCKD